MLGFAIAAFAISYISGEESKRQNKKATEARIRSEKINQRKADLEASKERIKIMREARIARASLTNAAATSGLGQSSSGISGGQASITSQSRGGVRDVNIAQDFSSMATNENINAARAAGKANEWQATAQQWQSIANIGFSLWQPSKPVKKA